MSVLGLHIHVHIYVHTHTTYHICTCKEENQKRSFLSFLKLLLLLSETGVSLCSPGGAETLYAGQTVVKGEHHCIMPALPSLELRYSFYYTSDLLCIVE